MLDDLILHYIATDNQSLIARIYGVCKVTSKSFAPFYIVIMQNTCLYEHKKRLVFDLKGSTVGRKTQVETKFWKEGMNCDKVLKDINFGEIQADLKRQLFKCGDEKKLDILDILKRDSMFLSKRNIMDYSLLLVIEDFAQASPLMSLNVTNSQENYETRNKVGLQHLGIIDYLQDFDFSKKTETCWKSRVLGKSKSKLSSVHPNIYQARFMTFMRDIVFAKERDDYISFL